jgi:predicted phosphodiesterase
MDKENKETRHRIVRELLTRNPTIPHNTAAKLLHEAYPALFTTKERARSIVRATTGNNGREHRKYNANARGDLYRQPFTGEALPIPTPFWDSTPFVFDTESCLIIADLHIPFHEPDAIEQSVKYGKKAGVKDVLILGDAFDHYQESDFCRVPNVSTLKQELKDGRQFLVWLRKKFPKARIVFKEGNHEERFAIKVHKVMPELEDLLDNFTYEKFGFDELGIELVKDRRRIDMGYLTALHGHELGRGTSNLVSPARTLQLRGKECGIVAHWHQATKHRVKTLRQNQIGTWSVGCLCNLTPHYRPVNDWSLGFIVFRRLDQKGNFFIDAREIIKGDVW